MNEQPRREEDYFTQLHGIRQFFQVLCLGSYLPCFPAPRFPVPGGMVPARCGLESDGTSRGTDRVPLSPRRASVGPGSDNF